MNSSIKKELILEGLRCAGCASKIEHEVSMLNGVSQASLNFFTKTLTIEAKSKRELESAAAKAALIAQQIESGVKVVEKDGYKANTATAAFNKPKLIRLGVGTALFLAAFAVKSPYILMLSLFLAGYLLIGGDVIFKAARNILHGRVFDEYFLMSIATMGAFAVKEFSEGIAVILFYQIGELLQEAAVNRSRKSIAALMDIRPDYANLKSGDNMVKVSPAQVSAGDIIVIKPGEKVPLDGRVVSGKSVLDVSVLTGESAPREVEAGSEILSGSININGLLTVEVTKGLEESVVYKILNLVQNANDRKSKTENFITRFAGYYTPAVVLAAASLAIVPPMVLPGATLSQWIYRALVFLVVSCPCALVISIPLGFFGGIGGASKNGILINGSNFLEALGHVDTVVFDKTGTLTNGAFNVTQVNALGNIDGAELLEYAAYAESYSNHPIAASILKAYGREPDKKKISGYNEISGYGVKARAMGKDVIIGNSKIMAQEHIPYVDSGEAGTVVHVALDGAYAGHIVISDEIKEDSPKAVKALRSAGVKRLAMLTGDNKAVGEKVGKALGLDEIYAELLPAQKVEKLEMLCKSKPKKGRLVFVGDGINDAPVLARADVGVAMGGLGSDAAIEAADVVIMNDQPSKLAEAIKIAKKTKSIVWQNIVFALGVKALVLVLGGAGIATMWEAVFADVGVTLIAVLNTLRVLKSH